MYKTYGSPLSSTWVIQPVGDFELEQLNTEMQVIEKEIPGKDFFHIAFPVKDWDRELSPWVAPSVFGKVPFGDGAEETLRSIKELLTEMQRKYETAPQNVIIAGYSLAGLFALWAGCMTDTFSGVAAASPSVWFPGFTDFVKANPCKAKSVYLSLGDKESKSKNPVLKTVADCMKEVENILVAQNINTFFRWNEGNHFKESDVRTGLAIAWAIENTGKVQINE